MPIFYPEIKQCCAGVYVLSPKLHIRNTRTSFKIGRSIKMEKRLNGYHTCYNRGFYLYFAVTVNKDNNNEACKLVNRTEEEKQTLILLTTLLEKIMHNEVQNYRDQCATRILNSEWFRMGLQPLKRAVIRSIELYKEAVANLAGMTQVEKDYWINQVKFITIESNSPEYRAYLRALNIERAEKGEDLFIVPLTPPSEAEGPPPKAKGPLKAKRKLEVEGGFYLFNIL